MLKVNHIAQYQKGKLFANYVKGVENWAAFAQHPLYHMLLLFGIFLFVLVLFTGFLLGQLNNTSPTYVFVTYQFIYLPYYS
jgi:hypothetical protein